MPPLLLLAVAQEARYDVLVKGKKAGVATYALSDRKGGGRTTRLRIVLADGSITESVSESDAEGVAVRAANTLRRGKAGTRETVVYSPRGDATIVVNGGKPAVVRFAKGSRKDPSETWFRTTTPSVGAKAIFMALDSRKRVWEEVTVAYAGTKGRENYIRQVRNGVTTSFTLDDRGVPLIVKTGDLRMVRR